MTLSVAITHQLGGFALDVAFDAPAGVTVLYGPSGAGKTTIVQAVAGLIRPDRGRISLGGRVLLDSRTGDWVPPHRRRIGYVFQEARLFPHLTVRQNLLYGRWFAPKGMRRESLAHVVDLLGIASLLDRRPGFLSGGEKSRVAIGRALLSEPELILADEPLSALDDARKAEILPCFERLRESAVPILYVSHAVAEVARLATTVIALRDGRVTAIGPPGQVLGDVTATDLRDLMSVLTARVVAHHDDGMTELATAAGALWLPRVSAPPGAMVRLAIPAQEVILSRAPPVGLSALNILEGTITEMRPGHGPGVLVTLRIGAETIAARITQRSAQALELAPGQTCHAIIKSVALAPQNVGTARMPPG
jgi:molybdate transport system ATP-binding protein